MVSTQIQDSSQGVPGARIPVELDVFVPSQGWREVGHAISSDEGVIEDFGEAPAPGVYRLMFDVATHTPDSFFPSISITFEVSDASENYHIVLVLNSFGYSTYRQS